MIAAIVRGGRSSSFKGSLDYVLRDADGRCTERVGETQTINLFSPPERADGEMQATADAARAIQARARTERGGRAGASGSRAEKVCFHYALSWAHEDEPTTEQMFAAAHQTLERLGLTAHQAVIVEHTERLHKHLHVVVSTVHPETSRANSLYRNAYVLDRWCHEQEQKMGLFRTFKRAAKYEREHEWAKKKPAKELSQEDCKAAWDKRKRELSDVRERDRKAIKARQDQRRDEHNERVNEVRRHAEVDKTNARNRHRREIAEFWRKQAPKMSVQPRPSPSFLHGMATEGGEIGKALKGIVRPRYHPAPVQPEKPRAPVHSTFKRALSSTAPLQAPSPEQPRSTVNSQFRERSEPSKGNAVRHFGITDRFQGEQSIKRYQRGEIDEIDRRTREAIEQLRDDREAQAETDAREWADHKDKHDRLRDEARKELDIAEQEPREPEPEAEQAHPDSTSKPMDVRSYVDDYVAGRGRDSREHEQFAANYGPDIEAEFQRRATEADRQHDTPEPDIETDRFGNEIIDMNVPVEPPPLEPDSYVPEHQPPEPELDFEMGD